MPDQIDTTRYTVEVYRDANDEWRWATFAGNGEEVSASTEGYQNKDHAVEQAKALNPGIDVRVDDGD